MGLNVGGQKCLTSKSNLLMREPRSRLARMIDGSKHSMRLGSSDQDGAIFIDRIPRYFEPILNYLRTGSLIIDPGLSPEGVLEEARYFGIHSIIRESSLEKMTK